MVYGWPTSCWCRPARFRSPPAGRSAVHRVLRSTSRTTSAVWIPPREVCRQCRQTHLVGFRRLYTAAGVKPVSSSEFSIPAVQGGYLRQQPSGGNINHFGWDERCGRDEANRLGKPGWHWGGG